VRAVDQGAKGREQPVSSEYFRRPHAQVHEVERQTGQQVQVVLERFQNAELLNRVEEGQMFPVRFRLGLASQSLISVPRPLVTGCRAMGFFPVPGLLSRHIIPLPCHSHYRPANAAPMPTTL
jgi:hypothetical protein